jgi:hypothetical protein
LFLDLPGKEADMQERFDALKIFITAFSISSLGGLAALLRSHKEISWRSGISAFLYSGIMGLIIALLWYNVFDGQGNVYFLLGVSGLAGIGGTTVLDFLIQVIKKGGLTINIVPGDESPPVPPSDQEKEDESK